MVTATTSGELAVPEDLLTYPSFVGIRNKEYFAFTWYICFELLHSNVVDEISWQHRVEHCYMPYRISQTQSLREKPVVLEKKVEQEGAINNALQFA